MIRSITGEITSIGSDHIVVLTGNIGYLVFTPEPNNTGATGESITLHTYLVVRENILDLYGFTTEPTLEIFLLLLQLPKIGPKSALQILRQASPNLLLEATQKNDAVYLHKMSGIGKKTAEKIVTGLTDKIASLLPAQLHKNAESDTESALITDAVDALVAIGYPTDTARDVVYKIQQSGSQSESTSALVSQALKELGAAS